MIRLPALTIWQPWASLIIARAKPYEFRGCPAARAYRNRDIAIHAGRRRPVMAEIRALRLQLRGENATGLDAEIALPLLERWSQDPTALPLSSILGVVRLGEPVRADCIPEYAASFVNDSDRAEHANYGWPLSDVRPLTPPVPYRGAQGFWPCEIEGFADPARPQDDEVRP